MSRQSALLKQGFTTRSAYDDAVAEVREAEMALADAHARAANAGAAIAPGEQPSVAAHKQPWRRRGSTSPTPKCARRWTASSPTPTGFSRGRWSRRASACCRWSTARAPGSKPISRKRTSPEWSRARWSTIEIDAYPDHGSRAMSTASAPAPGSQFSVIPAQNANGNWVKVTQRVPVRIAFDGAPDQADDRRPFGNGHRRPGFRPLASGERRPGPSHAPASDGRADHRHHRGDDGRAAAGARHDHRQCRLAAHAGQPQRDPGHDQLGADQLHRRLGDRACRSPAGSPTGSGASGCWSSRGRLHHRLRALRDRRRR